MGKKADLSREAKLIYITKSWEGEKEAPCRMENGTSVSGG